MNFSKHRAVTPCGSTKGTDHDLPIGNGVAGFSDGAAAVAGESTDSPGVTGISMSGAGVIGTSSRHDGGVEISSTCGYALETKGGGARFHGISGVATIKSGDRKVTMRPRSPDSLIDARTFVLISPEVNIGSRSLWFSSSTPAAV